MAKRTVSELAVERDHCGKTAVPGASICSLTVDDEDASQDRPATALALCEETTWTEAAAEGALSVPLSWPFLCPLCSAVELADPVDLHEPVKDTLSPSSLHSKTVDEAVHCLACRACVEQWLSAVRAFSEDQTETMDHTGGATGATMFSPLSASACDCATLLACPLCNTTCDATILSTSGPIAGAARVPDASVVRNRYTGSQPLSCITRTGGGVGPPSAPAASASPFCSICEEAKAMCVCLQCDFGMCDTCHRATHAKGGFRQHEVLSCEQARRRANQRCTQHAGMALDLFCDTCSTCVCVTCCFGGAHRGHEVFPLADVVARAAAALTQHSTELAALQRVADATGVQFSSLWPAYEAKVDDVRTEIQQCFSSLRQVLQAREDALLSRLSEVSAVVGRRSSELRSAMHAISNLLGSTGERLRRLPGSVSPATLMRIFETVQEQQQWVSRVSTRVIEEATAVAKGWSYHISSDGANGCRMASFVLLNSDTPNDDGLRQYKRVLADLGRLDASADVQLPLAEQGSAGSVGTAKGHDNREKEGAAHHLWGGMAEDCMEPSDGLTNDAPVALCGDSDANFDAVANAGEGEETLLVRPSHIRPATPSLPGQAAASPSREVSMAYRGRDRGESRQRNLSASTVQSQPKPPHLFSIGASTQSTHGPLLTYELNVDPSVKGAGGVTGSAADATTASGTASLNGVASKWGDVKQALWEVGGCGSFAAELGALGRQTPGCAAAARGVRDTIPFRVALPPRLIESHDRMDDDDRSVREADDQLPWRALKLHHNSSVQDGVRSAATSLPRHGSTARLQYLKELDLRKPSEVAHEALDSSLSAPKQGRAESQRRTTGLQLEL
ncbi:putative tripartite motif protein [Leishmania donovani]|uniref:Tripartite motif protein n=1 Tax=Leishmania donovani TaxID=5661 RepID=A0A3S7XAN9_LEIDO|nr:putative tripartite motif protein [Leishmania donovani]